MYEVIFLWLLALIYIIFAVIQDIKTKEIANWLSFSLIIFALGFRFFYSLFQGDNFLFFYNGIIGLGIFFIVGNLLYYGRVFAGGDAKLMISMGTILPYFPNFSLNSYLFFDFILIFLSVGFIYVFLSSIFLCIKKFHHFKREFIKQFHKNKKMMIAFLLLSVIILSLGFAEKIFFVFGVLIFFSSYLYLYSKAIDESCMVKKIKTKDLRRGDMLYADLKIGKKILKARWEGLSKEDIRKIKKKYKRIKIKEGIPFSPVFLISFLIFIVINLFNLKLWNPLW